jgi:Zn-dependent M28 family amino/carboxypeptidase
VKSQSYYAHAANGQLKEVQNLIVQIDGQGGAYAQEIIVLGAHYDTVKGSPGANDNTSGVSALLELARMLKSSKPARTIRFVAFANEERPYAHSEEMGSNRYAQLCQSRKEKVVAMFSLETMGFYSDKPGSQKYPFPFSYIYPDVANFISMVSNADSAQLTKQAIKIFREEEQFPSQGIAAASWVPSIDRSDHASFWRAGYPALMVTDTANFRYPYYHTAGDTAEKVNYDHLSRVVDGLAKVVRKLAS